MTEEIIIDKEDKTKKHRNNEIDCLHFGCRKGESGNVLFWCDFYDDHCDNYTGCYYRKYLRLEQENKILKSNTNVLNDYIIKNEQLKTNIDSLVKKNEKLKKEVKQIGSDFIKKGDYARELEKENKELKEKYTHVLELAKTNADSNEYCLQELEKENKELKALNKKICEDCSKEIKVYWAAFEEIRKKCNWANECSVTNNNLWEYDEILEIINECLGE